MTMSMTQSAADIVRRSYEAFARRDRAAVESILSDDFTFTSPYDDHINRSAYFERCWPFGDTIDRFEILDVMESGDRVVIVYEIKPKHGDAFRNSERLRVEAGQIKEVEVFFGALAAPQSTESLGNADDLAAIRELIERRGDALRSRNVDDLYEQVAPENVAFDVVNPLQYTGSIETRKRAEEWFSTFDGPIGYEVRDLQVAAGGEIGFAHCLTRIGGTTRNGALNMWLRSTMCFRKYDGRWMVVHEHSSVPFDPTTGEASLDLEP